MTEDHGWHLYYSNVFQNAKTQGSLLVPTLPVEIVLIGNVAVTRDSCVIWYDEISKRRNTVGQTCAADTYRPRRHVPLSPRSSCNRGSPGVITGQAVLNQWVASRNRHLSTLCSRSFRCPPSHPIPPSRAPSHQISILRIPPLNSLYPRSRKILPQTSVI
jgi:hypothetical protein